MQDEPQPPRKTYGFKPREFERANPARPEPPSDATPPTRDPGIAPADSGTIDVNDLIRAGVGSGPQLGANAAPNRSNDVHAMLRDNLARADAAGLNDVTLPPKRISKRTRDYFLMLIGGNVVLAGGFFLQPIFAGAGVVLYNTGLAWIMWFVMDAY
jgi:hypothetical protein